MVEMGGSNIAQVSNAPSQHERSGSRGRQMTTDSKVKNPRADRRSFSYIEITPNNPSLLVMMGTL